MNMEQKIDSCPKALFSVMDAFKKKHLLGGREVKKRKKEKSGFLI